jgi:hypothetical protein
MEKEIAELRRRLATGEYPQEENANEEDDMNDSSGEVYYAPHSPPPSSRAQSLSVSVEQQASPMRRPAPPPHVATEPAVSRGNSKWTLEDISLSKPRITRLFEQ